MTGVVRLFCCFRGSSYGTYVRQLVVVNNDVDPGRQQVGHLGLRDVGCPLHYTGGCAPPGGVQQTGGYPQRAFR